MTPVDGESEEATDTHRALVASQLMGLAYTRYVLRVPPISTASPSEASEKIANAYRRASFSLRHPPGRLHAQLRHSQR